MRRVDLMSKTTTLVTMLSIVYALIDMKIIFLAPILTISIPYRFMKYKEEGKHTENRKILNNLLLFNLIVFIGVIAITNRMSTDIFEIIVNIIITFIYFKVLSMIDKKREILYNNPQMVYDKINEKINALEMMYEQTEEGMRNAETEKARNSMEAKLNAIRYKIDELKRQEEFKDIPIIEDLGSGVFIDLSKYGLSYEPTVIDSIKKGADVVTFSGDKMLGGPQAGIIVGKKKYIEKMKKNQLTRALRVDKMTIAALEATLRIYLDEEDAIKSIPTLRMITYSIEELEIKATILLSKIIDLNIDAEVEKEKGISQVGGGSMPLERLDTYVITIKPNKFSVSYLEKKLRNSESHIIGRINEDKYILDVRTIEKDEFDFIIKELKDIFN